MNYVPRNALVTHAYVKKLVRESKRMTAQLYHFVLLATPPVNPGWKIAQSVERSLLQ